jgi:prepilin-type N-terminal cleavage/methylation domain-containing protein/prepilin-type processing-associated H-X9-DG protein
VRLLQPSITRRDSGRRPAFARPAEKNGFTLLEVLVVVAIVSALTALLIPALRSVRGQARRLHCASNLRNITIDFQLFASGESDGGQGDSERLGATRFRINDFLDRTYRLDEFWDLNSSDTGELTASRESSLCPSGAPSISKRRGFPCGQQSLFPVEDVSLAFNMRLYRGVIEWAGTTLLAPVSTTHVRASILHHPYVPLVMDVDAKHAVEAGFEPFYIAPGRPNDEGPYAQDRYWFPSSRHAGAANVGFVGGHVLTSRQPQRENWNWEYTANVGN